MQTFTKTPSEAEWSVCRKLSGELAEQDSASTRSRLRRRLYGLLKKYPGNVDIMASLGDICVYNRQAIKLLQVSYDAAQKNKDFKNLTFIADSLVGRYLATRNYEQVHFWCKELAENLKNFHDQEICDNLPQILESVRFMECLESNRADQSDQFDKHRADKRQKGNQ